MHLGAGSSAGTRGEQGQGGSQGQSDASCPVARPPTAHGVRAPVLVILPFQAAYDCHSSFAGIGSKFQST